jgi:nitrogen fixation protein NifU and related proteins
MTQDLYQEIILEEFANPRHKGQLPDADVKIAEMNASCGDEIEVFLKFDKSGQKIEKVSWRGIGCAISMATASLVSDFILDKKITEVLEIKQEELENLLGIDDISPGRLKCLFLALKAFHKAIYKHFPELKESE